MNINDSSIIEKKIQSNKKKEQRERYEDRSDNKFLHFTKRKS